MADSLVINNSELSIMREMQQMKSVADKVTLNQGKVESGEFYKMLHDMIAHESNQEIKTEQLQEAYERDDPNVKIAQVMINMQKSTLELKTMIQVRNKVLNAYKEVMGMQL